MEHHTPENIQEDVDYLTDLEADFVQFMLLTPLPVTELYREKQAAGLLREDLPYEEWHGQKLLNWRHPHFPADEAERWLRRAFRQEYEVNSSSMLRVADTALRGYEALAGLAEGDPCLEARLAQMRTRAREYSLILPAIARAAVNGLERERVAALERRVRAAFGAPGVVGHALRLVARAAAARWRWRVRLAGDGIQPRTMVTRYRGAGAPAPTAVPAGLPAAAAAAPRHQAPEPSPSPAGAKAAART
jgi:hypothetical protein